MALPFQADSNDIFILAKTIYGEARGEPEEGKIAVGWVVRNRAQCVLDHGSPHMFGSGTIASAALAPWQFSCNNSNSPEETEMASLTEDSTDPVFLACRTSAEMVIDGVVDDPTDSSMWYHTVAMGWPGEWGKQIPATRQIGSQLFYNKLVG